MAYRVLALGTEMTAGPSVFIELSGPAAPIRVPEPLLIEIVPIKVRSDLHPPKEHAGLSQVNLGDGVTVHQRNHLRVASKKKRQTSPSTSEESQLFPTQSE